MNDLPDFFIVGAAKSGTTSLYHYLKTHPQVYMSPVKEPNFFSDDIDLNQLRPSLKKRLAAMQGDKKIAEDLSETIHTYYIRDLDLYKRLFKKSDVYQKKGEASVSYLYSQTAPKNIFSLIPSAKIIIILRDPIQRAFSHYLMDLRLSFTKKKFLEAIKEDMQAKYRGWGATSLYVDLGWYYDPVKRFLDTFPLSQVKIFLYDDLKNNPHQVVKTLYEFIGINSDFKPRTDEKFHSAEVPRNKITSALLGNDRIRLFARKLFAGSSLKKILKNLAYRKDNLPVLMPQEKKALAEKFKDDVSKLEKLIQRDLSHWLIQ